jgi:hypothetical protein
MEGKIELEVISSHFGRNVFSVMSFTKKTTSKITFHYNIKERALQKVTEMRDLGVLFDEKLSLLN